MCRVVSCVVVLVSVSLCRFTTLEGLLINIKEDLENNPFLMGDSSKDDRKDVVEKLLENLQEVNMTVWLLVNWLT